jgi:hypothetical protein
VDNSRTDYAVQVDVHPHHEVASETAPPVDVMMPVPVSVGHPVKTYQQSAQFGHYFTFVIPPGSANATMILPEDPDRLRAVLQVNGSSVVLCNSQSAAQAAGNIAPSSASVMNAGSVTGPTAGQAITSITIPFSGVWQIGWTVGLGGTTAGADRNNFQLQQGVSVLLTSMNASGTGTQSTEPTVTLPLSAGTVISVNAIGAGTGTAIYSAQLVAVPVTNPVPSTPAGFIVAKNTSPPPLESQSPVWAVNTDPSTTAYVSVCVERVNP